eukprot:scaffold133446_cov63-Phaeocystis_antarctica.AAC.3
MANCQARQGSFRAISVLRAGRGTRRCAGGCTRCRARRLFWLSSHSSLPSGPPPWGHSTAWVGRRYLWAADRTASCAPRRRAPSVRRLPPLLPPTRPPPPPRRRRRPLSPLLHARPPPPGSRRRPTTAPRRPGTRRRPDLG